MTGHVPYNHAGAQRIPLGRHVSRWAYARDPRERAHRRARVCPAAATRDSKISSKIVTAEYSAHHLQVLEGLEAVRKRPGRYIGSNGSPGLMHCLWEIIHNSVDEAVAGKGGP